jgi:hypothetical protein
MSAVLKDNTGAGELESFRENLFIPRFRQISPVDFVPKLTGDFVVNLGIKLQGQDKAL